MERTGRIAMTDQYATQAPKKLFNTTAKDVSRRADPSDSEDGQREQCLGIHAFELARHHQSGMPAPTTQIAMAMGSKADTHITGAQSGRCMESAASGSSQKQLIRAAAMVTLLWLDHRRARC